MSAGCSEYPVVDPAAIARIRAIRDQIDQRRQAATDWAAAEVDKLRLRYCPVYFKNNRASMIRSFADMKARESIQLGQSDAVFYTSIGQPAHPTAREALAIIEDEKRAAACVEALKPLANLGRAA